ncbi:MAG: precorrin-2 C(20)-methyltransferase [Oscillospiraceae bacterium]|nr:precorrin-2 C(20)-methyltransferase [Oscillospiraceae bacterium]
MMKKGIFYAVGVGVESMDLTLRAKQVLEQADVIVKPVKQIGASSVAYTIAEKSVNLKQTETIELVFPMQIQTDYYNRLQNGCLQPICDCLEAGKNVAMVTLGDVSIYSTATYVRQVLAEKGYETAVVAGISSFSAGAAKAECSLCENQESLIVLPVVTSKAEVEAVLEQFDTLVLMKAGKALPWLIPLLTEKKLLSHTTMFCNIGMEGEYIGIPSIQYASYFTTLIIKKRQTNGMQERRLVLE